MTSTQQLKIAGHGNYVSTFTYPWVVYCIFHSTAHLDHLLDLVQKDKRAMSMGATENKSSLHRMALSIVVATVRVTLLLRNPSTHGLADD